MKTFSRLKNTILSPAFQLRPFKWIEFYQQHLRTFSLEKSSNEFLELLSDLISSIKSLNNHEWYLSDNSEQLLRIRDLELTQPLSDLSKQLFLNNHNTALNKEKLGLLAQQQPTKKSSRVFSEQALIDWKSDWAQAEKESRSLAQELQKLKQQTLDTSQQVLSELSQQLKQIPEHNWNFNRPEFEERFDLLDAHHDSQQIIDKKTKV